MSSVQKTEIEIRGIMVRLRSLTESDAAEIVRLRNNPEINRYLSNKGQIARVEDQLNWQRHEQAAGQNYNFAVLLNEIFTGTCSVYNLKDGEAEFGRYIVTNPIAAIESEYLCAKFGFATLGLRQIVCKTTVENQKVWKQHLRLGFTPAGEGFDERIQQPLIIQVLTAENFARFDYEPLLSLVRKFKR